MPSYPPPGNPPAGYRPMSADVPPNFRGSVPPVDPPGGGPGGGGGGFGGGGNEPRRRRNRGLLITRIIAAVVAAAVFIGAGAAYAFTDKLQSASGTSDAAQNAGDAGVISAEGLTFLLVGSDSRTDADGNPLSAEELAQIGTEDDGGGINTDTIMIVHVPQGGGRATAVSVPRDTWIGTRVTNQVVGPYANGSEGTYQPNKVNSFYATAKAYTQEHLVSQGVTDKAQIERESNEAGRTMLIRVLQAFTGLKIDHYAEVNLLGFYLLSNAIGGVPVCLNAPVDDPWSGANFPAGEQDVQGTAALSFVRQRHGLPEGDLDRVRRQQAFLRGAADKILSVGTLTNPGKLQDLVSAIDRSVIFDKGFDVITFAETLPEPDHPRSEACRATHRHSRRRTEACRATHRHNRRRRTRVAEHARQSGQATASEACRATHRHNRRRRTRVAEHARQSGRATASNAERPIDTTAVAPGEHARQSGQATALPSDPSTQPPAPDPGKVTESQQTAATLT